MIVILTSYDLLPIMTQKQIWTILKFYIYVHLENEVSVIINSKWNIHVVPKHFVRNCVNKQFFIKKIPRFKMLQKNKPSSSYLIFSLWNMKVLNI
jgi:hypothetical protein